uniref:Uncharacterized protein n=1 Tax=Trichogramma kaykai TaxID=54128 RepID=A0ABD2VYR4_9HYME
MQNLLILGVSASYTSSVKEYFIERILDDDGLNDIINAEHLRHGVYNLLQQIHQIAIDSGRVIVGLRFKMQSGMLSIEAKIAKLLPSGKIDEKSQIWRGQNSKLCDLDKLVEYEDYVKLSELRRSFVLDDVELGNDYVLTGVKFVYENGFNKLAARGHKFDFKNGSKERRKKFG